MSTLKFVRKPLSEAECSAEVTSVLNTLLGLFTPRAIFLFGSAALGTATDQSDLDFLIVLFKESDLPAARKAVAKARPFSKFPIDLIWMTEEQFKHKAKIGGIAQTVTEDGRLVYGEPL